MTLKPEIASQLEDCFAVVFPDVPRNELLTAAIGSVAKWDSLATLTLVSVIEETFQISVPLDDLEQFLSFELILKYLTRPASRAAA
ncbi:MAG: acyl carrier protein [Planctomycetota bacterium]|nr:MAG: acyl carrier protein [Planctomycetota bacterium]